jgi:diguanylate cyclase (GGDEF)-like protein
MLKTAPKKPNILVVISPSRDSALISYALQKCGYQIQEVENSESALKHILESLPDLVLLDVCAPVDEQKQMKQLFNTLQQKQVPTVLITSENPSQELKTYLTYPVLHHIQRPIDAIGLVLRIKSALREKEVKAELELIRNKLDESHRKLQERSIIDDLTETASYGHLLSQVKVEFARGVRHNAPLAFVLVEISCLDQIEKSYGAEVMGNMLREIIQRIKASLRLTDTIGRFGENRLGILLPETNINGAKRIIDKVSQVVKANSFNLPTQTKPTSSIGIPPAVKLDIYAGISAYPDKRVANYEELIEDAVKSLALVKEQEEALVSNSSPRSHN